ncbi:hypothetical protein VYU27_007334, partial [Nannochloropsis oceanica]
QECQADPASGEFQYRGRHVFMGYLHNLEETKQALLPGGWLRSGDVASIDADHEPNTPKPSGFVRITGRIKELIITAGGENIPPVLIENELKAALPALASCMVVGDQKKYLTVLLTVHLTEEGKLTGPSLEAGQALGSEADTPAAVRADPLWQDYFNAGLKTANSKATSRAQFVQRYAVLDKEFSEKDGDLTPTLKLKRSVVAKKQAALIESLYK